MSILLILDQERAKEDSRESRRSYRSHLAILFQSCRKREKEKGMGKTKIKMFRGLLRKRNRQTKRTETRPTSKITNFDFCLVYRFYLFTIALNIIFMVLCYLYRKPLKYSQRLTSPSDRALAYSTAVYDHAASTVGSQLSTRVN